jgi:hypothetical protein
MGRIQIWPFHLSYEKHNKKGYHNLAYKYFLDLVLQKTQTESKHEPREKLKEVKN